jgi:HAD superfamily 5'-nucleotidase-like hydrolase
MWKTTFAFSPDSVSTVSVRPSSEIDPRHRIFCNRSLNMKTIKAIGFDMDYTLGVYRPETFEVLAYEETLKKLVKMGYPDQILKWTFDWRFMIRGLAIDKSRGNIIKLDRHHYVKVAYHGFRELSREERRSLYDVSRVQAYEEPQFTLIDTLFALAEAYLFCQLVELKDAHPELCMKSYPEMYRDIRTSIDDAHRDGSIKDKVARDPGRYIVRDPELVKTLQKLKESGRKLFIVTNSLWEYTNVVMSHLFGESADAKEHRWIEMFDVVIVGSSKPGFFMQSNPLYEVDPATGWMRNASRLPLAHRVFQGGNFRQLHQLLDVQVGSQILYVGDHIYGDILRSKKEIGWRTMLIIEELEGELETYRLNADGRNHIWQMMRLKDDLDDQLQQLLWRYERIHNATRNGVGDEAGSGDLSDLQERIRQLAEERNAAREALREHLREYHRRFHPIWGQLMKTGHQNSRFAQQVEVYACLYSSRVSNLLPYPPSKSFQSTTDVMPHEL